MIHTCVHIDLGEQGMKKGANRCSEEGITTLEHHSEYPFTGKPNSASRCPGHKQRSLKKTSGMYGTTSTDYNDETDTGKMWNPGEDVREALGDSKSTHSCADDWGKRSTQLHTTLMKQQKSVTGAVGGSQEARRAEKEVRRRDTLD